MLPKKYAALLLPLFLLLPALLAGQVPWDKLALADSLYRANDFAGALEQYKPVLKFYNEKRTFHKAARCAAAVKDKKLAMGYLKKAADLGWSNARILQSDQLLAPLASDGKFIRLIQRVEAFENRIKVLKTPALLGALDSIYADDQKYRGRRPDEKAQARLDSANFLRMQRLIGEHGWLGSNLLDGRNYCWLVIQRQSLEVQKQYYPMMAKAVKKGEEDPAFLAYLEDKIAVAQGEKQKYGTQVDAKNQKIYPLLDPEKVDLYRAKVGLSSIEILKKRYLIDR